jgi:hypothetical protein
MEWFIGPTNQNKENRTTYIPTSIFKPASLQAVYEDISQEETLFNSGGNGMLVQHPLSSLDLLYL